MLALAGTILGPILGTLLLQRTALLSGSSAFSVKLFLLASGIKPISHIFHLSTTTNTQQPLQNDPMPSSLSQEFLQGEGVEGKGRLAGGRSSLEREQIEDLKVQIECLKVRMNEMEAQSVPRPELERSLDTLALAVRKQRRQTTRLDHELDAITSLAAPSLALAHKSRTPRSSVIGPDPSKVSQPPSTGVYSMLMREGRQVDANLGHRFALEDRLLTAHRRHAHPRSIQCTTYAMMSLFIV